MTVTESDSGRETALSQSQKLKEKQDIRMRLIMKFKLIDYIIQMIQIPLASKNRRKKVKANKLQQQLSLFVKAVYKMNEQQQTPIKI